MRANLHLPGGVRNGIHSLDHTKSRLNVSCLGEWVVRGVCLLAANPTRQWWSELYVRFWAISFCLPSSGASVSAALQCYSADHDPEIMPRNHTDDCRQARANQHSHCPAWHLAKLCICSPKSEHSMQIWKLFQDQILVAHNYTIQVRGIVRISWISDVTLPFFFIQLWKTFLK